jgi:ribose transport system substrate-binding protein
MKKVLVVMLCLLAVASFAFAGGSTESAKVKVGIAVPTADHGWTGGVGWWADKAVEELQPQYSNIEFKVEHAANTTEQVKQVEDLLTWGMNYLVILPHEGAAMYTTVKAASDAGVKCVIVDRGFDSTQADFGYVYLAGDNAGLGKLSGEFLAKYMKENGLTNYVAMGGMATPIDTQRMQAFFDEMEKESSLVNLEGGRNYQFTNWDSQKGLEVMENLLQKYPEIDAVFCQDDDVLTGVLAAINEAKRTDIKVAIGGAGSKVVFKKILDNDALVKATVTYPPRMIYEAIKLAIEYINGKTFPTTASETVILPAELVTAENAKDFYVEDSAY